MASRNDTIPTHGSDDSCFPYWWDTATAFEPPAAELPPETDVAIVGAGYSGVSAARVLAERGASVDVLDARTLGWGASTRNGGMMIVGLKHGPETLVQMYGEELGRRLFQCTLEANRHVEDLIAREKIDCDYSRAGHVTAAFKRAHYESLVKEAEFLETRFGHQCKVLARNELGEELDSHIYQGALVDSQSGGLHAAKYFHGLSSLASRAGARLHPNTPVLAVKRVSQGFEIDTARGRLRAREVLVSTNGYTPGLLPQFKRRVIPMGSYIVVTEPLDPAVAKRLIPGNRMIIDTKHVLYYFRRTPDDRLLFGGRASFSPTTVESSREILRRSIKEVFPQLPDLRIDYAWKGHVAFTFDFLPHLGRHSDGIYYSMGYNGHGVAMGSYLGAKVGAMIASDEAPRPALSTLPFPSRAYYHGDPWFLPLAGFWYRLLDSF